MKKNLLICISFTFFSQLHAQTIYSTVSDGNWSSPLTWSAGQVPPSNINSLTTVNINHDVTYNLSNDLEVNGKVLITGDTLRFPKDGNSTGTGKSIFIRSSGLMRIISGGLIMPIFLSSGSNNSGNFLNEGGRVVFINSLAEIAQNWSAKQGGKRYFEGSCLRLGENYINVGATDTLSNVCMTIGLHGSSNFENDGGTIRMNNTSVLLQGSGSFNNKSSSSYILTYLNAPFALVGLQISNGNLENNGTWTAPINQYCISGNIQGSASLDIDFTVPENCQFFNAYVCSCEQSAAGPLPILLRSFTASRNKMDVILQWETESEFNNSGFLIERNVNGTWQQIAEVSSKGAGGNSNSSLKYEYFDSNGSKNITLYRFKQVDFSGASRYSETRAVRGDGQTDKITIFPNPSTDGTLTIKFDDQKVHRDIVMVNMNGQVIKKITGVTSNTVQLFNLNSGVYVLKIMSGPGSQFIEKIIVNNK